MADKKYTVGQIREMHEDDMKFLASPPDDLRKLISKGELDTHLEFHEQIEILLADIERLEIEVIELVIERRND